MKKNNLKGHSFKDHPQRINKAGRPRRSKAFTGCAEYLTGLNIGTITHAEYLDLYRRLFVATKDQLLAIQRDENAPWELRGFAGGLLNRKTFFEFHKLHLNRAFGRPVQAIALEARIEPIKPSHATATQQELLDDFDAWMDQVQEELTQQK